MSGPPVATAAPPLALAGLLDAVAQPLLLVDAQGLVRHANAALADLVGLPGDALRGQPATRWFEPDEAPAPAAGGTGRLRPADAPPHPVRWSRRALQGTEPALQLITLTDLRDQVALREQLNHVVSVLDQVQDFGRIGLWERGLDDLGGWWDRHMFRFWGLPPADTAPGFDQALQAVAAEDQPLLRAAFERSLQQPGRHECRYRVHGADGVTRMLHSQWQVLADAGGRPNRMLGVVSDDSEADARARRANEATAQLALAADLADVAVWRHDLQTNLVYYSDKAWAVLDMPPRTEPLTLDEVRALIHPDDLAHVRASAELSLASQEPVDMRARYRSRTRGWRDVLTRRVVQRGPDGRPIAFLGVALDITEQVQRQRRERDLGRRLELAATAAGVGIWSMDVASGELHWNEQMRALHGLPQAEPAPQFRQYLQRFLPSDHQGLLRDALDTLTRRGDGQLDLDLPILRADGQTRRMAMRVGLQPTESGPQFVGAMIDVTDRRAADLALRRAHERVALATRGAGLATWEQDLITGKGWWDEQMWRLRGLPPQGHDAPDNAARLALLHPDDRERVAREHDEGNRQQRATSMEFRVIWPDGRQRWLASRSTPIVDDDGRTTRRIGVNWDITDARAAEAARQAELSAQRESQAKSQFLARMSHELRTPLNAVIGFTQLLQADDPRVDTATRRRQLDHIRMAGEHLLALIDDVLDLSSLESGELRLTLSPQALAPLAQEALSLMQEQADRQGVTLHNAVQGDIAQADPTRLRQVLLNLLSNAIKYNRRAGQVRVETETSGDKVLLRVWDDGPGMTREQLRHLFEPFNRLGAERGDVAGTGIGLAIVKANVERMGGSVRVQSRPGVGTRVEVRLSRADTDDRPDRQPPAAGEGAVAPSATPAPADSAARRLLYIEDNPVNALIVREIVARRASLTLETAGDGLAGVAAAQSRPPHLVLVDMQLPDIDGLEVLHRLRADPRTADLPCVALSANAMQEDIQRALAAGFDDYWTKPLDVRAFLAGLDRLLA
jgi:hypothetical protein